MSDIDLNHSMEYSVEVKNRLRRVEGQIRGILKMMDQQKGCRDLVTQLTAVRSAVDRVMMYIVASNMEQCIRHELESGDPADEIIREAIEMLMKSR